jgi:glutaminase
MKSALTALSICLLFTTATAADDAKGMTECTNAAFTEYMKAMSPFINSGEISVQSTLVRRRLAENYCLKWVHCLNDGSPVERDALVLGGMFSSCLTDGATLK